jgi:hypothetical protein
MYIGLHVKCSCSCQILMKLEFSRQYFQKVFKFQISWKSVKWEPRCSMRTDGQTDGHDEANSRFTQFFESAWKRSGEGCSERHYTYCYCWLKQTRFMLWSFEAVPARPSVKVIWKQGKSLGSEEGKAMGNGLLRGKRLSIDWPVFLNWDGVCLLRGTDWVFISNSG